MSVTAATDRSDARPVPDLDTVKELIRQVAREAIMPRFRRLNAGDVRMKNHPRDFVTVADTESERLLSEGLTALIPGSRVVGEEAAESDPTVIRALGGDQPVWVLDPVDGTANFVDGRVHFAVIVAYVEAGVTRVGWIFEPVSDRFVWAEAGAGAWIEEAGAAPRRLSLDKPKPLSDMTGFLGGPAAERLRMFVGSGAVWAPSRFSRLGCTGSEYIALATGERDFAQYIRLKPWDHAAGVLIHAEAGGYSGLRYSKGLYRPGPEISTATILITPDAATWRALDAAL